MDAKEIVTRLEIIKLATTIGDHSTIAIQTDSLKSANSSRLNEISSLLNSKNYRQGLYLIKSYLSDMGGADTFDNIDVDSEGERVLDIEDMLRMSPLAKETIKDYKRSVYTKDDLEAFAKNIEVSPIDEKISKENNLKSKNLSKDENSQKSSEENINSFVESIEEELKEPKELKTQNRYEPTKEDIEKGKEISSALESADSETPLDEISAEVMGSSTKKKRTKVLSKYKTLRAKFAKKDSSIDDSNTKIEDSKEIEKSKTPNKEDIKNDKKIEISNSDTSLEIEDTNSNISSKDNLEINSQVEIKEDMESKDTLENKDTTEISDASESKDKTEISDTNSTRENDINESDLKSNESKSKLSQEKQIAQDKKDRETIYSAIPNIEDKFREAFALYPPVKESDIWTQEVIRFLKGVTVNSFSELDVKQLLDEYNYYLGKNDIAKASQVLLLASVTDSKYAKFLLARELFSGKVIKRDLKKSFILMKELANSFYPEAVCDLGQFYEYGIGVQKDKKVAIRLYEKAFELGVSRATKHINRLKESSGILSTIFKIK
jgi:hypothetical protein